MILFRIQLGTGVIEELNLSHFSQLIEWAKGCVQLWERYRVRNLIGMEVIFRLSNYSIFHCGLYIPTDESQDLFVQLLMFSLVKVAMLAIDLLDLA